MNHSLATARALKASKLLWALEAQGKRVGLNPDTVAGVNCICELVDRMGDSDWLLLAHNAQVNPPSAETRTLVLLMLKTRAAWLFDQPVPKSLTYSQRPGPVEVVP